MGCRIIEGKDYAAFYCSTTMRAFGPVMDSYEEAEAFTKWLEKDPREYDRIELEELFYDFRVRKEKGD